MLYTSEDASTRLDLRVDGHTVWLTQLEIAELFQTTKQNINHARHENIFKEGELGENSVVKESLTTAADGKRYKPNNRANLGPSRASEGELRQKGGKPVKDLLDKSQIEGKRETSRARNVSEGGSTTATSSRQWR